MGNFYKILLGVLILLIFSCRQSNKKNMEIPHGWVKGVIGKKWFIYTPVGFICKDEQGVDSYPGIIYSKKDSIFLQFDSGSELYKTKNCSFDSTYRIAKGEILTGFYTKDIVQVDTIDNRIAVITKPLEPGNGKISVELFADCKAGAWLGISGTDLSAKKRAIVLEIFKMVKYK